VVVEAVSIFLAHFIVLRESSAHGPTTMACSTDVGAGIDQEFLECMLLCAMPKALGFRCISIASCNAVESLDIFILSMMHTS
jgi:hypothetical protein